MPEIRHGAADGAPMNTENIPCEIEITPQMVKAGVRVLAEEAGVVSEYVAEDLAPHVFREMMAARHRLSDDSVGLHEDEG